MSTGSQEAARTSGGQGEFGPGALIGGSYRLINFIGAGAMGDVYKARHEMMPREYALKILNENQVTENAWRRFQLEAQAIAKLNHKSIVSIHNFGIHNGNKPFYVMELLEGESLFDRLNRCEFLTVAEALPIFIELCDAFGYAHKQGIIHRDIKPQNIILLNKPELGSAIRIVDFGIAKLTQTTDPQNQNLTRMGEVFGSPFYMSPEQTMGQRVDSRSDIYSLGCTLYETLVSMPPLRGRNSTETMILHQTKIPPMLKEASDAQTFSDGIEYLVAKMLAKAPADRYQTMEAVKHDLELLQQGKDLNTVSYYAAPSPRRSTQKIEAHVEERGGLREELSESSQYTVPPSTSKNIAPFIAGVIFILVVGGGAGVFVFQNSSKESKTLRADVTRQPETKGSTDAGIAEVDGNGKIEDAFGSDKAAFIDTSDPNCYLNKPYKYSRLNKLPGKPPTVDFNFPKEIELGTIYGKQQSQGAEGVIPYIAKGKVSIPKDSFRYLAPSPSLLKYTGYLQGFQKGDLIGISLIDKQIDSESIKKLSVVPGIKNIYLYEYDEIPGNTLKNLRHLKNLEVIDIFQSAFDFSGFDKASVPLSLQAIRINSISREFNINLKDLQDYPITELTLNFHTSPQQIEDIRYLKSLTTLRIGGKSRPIGEKELDAICSLQKLERLELWDCTLPEDAEMKLFMLKKLRSLVLPFNKEGSLTKKRLEAKNFNARIFHPHDPKSE